MGGVSRKRLALKLLELLKQIFEFFKVYITKFIKDQCSVRAAALTYTTLLSIVPLMAVAISLSRGMGITNLEVFRAFLLKITAHREQVVDMIMEFIGRINATTLGTVGVVFLFFMAVTVFANIEASFNIIWKVEKRRPIGRMFTDYLAAIVVYPFLVATGIGAASTLKNYQMVQRLLSYSFFSRLYIAFLKIVPVVLVWVAFFIIYKFMPNTKVKFKSAAISSVVFGSVWQVAQTVYLMFQAGMTKYNVIYGSLSQLLLFLIWIYITWMLVLAGAEFCFFLQNPAFIKIKQPNRISLKSRFSIWVFCLKEVSKAFLNGKAVSISALASSIGLPEEVLTGLLQPLAEAGYIRFVQDREAVLGMPPEKITFSQLRAYLETLGEQLEVFDLSLIKGKKNIAELLGSK